MFWLSFRASIFLYLRDSKIPNFFRFDHVSLPRHVLGQRFFLMQSPSRMHFELESLMKMGLRFLGHNPSHICCDQDWYLNLELIPWIETSSSIQTSTSFGPPPPGLPNWGHGMELADWLPTAWTADDWDRPHDVFCMVKVKRVKRTMSCTGLWQPRWFGLVVWLPKLAKCLKMQTSLIAHKLDVNLKLKGWRSWDWSRKNSSWFSSHAS